MAANKKAGGREGQGLINGGIGGAELFSLALCLPLGGLAFSAWPIGYGGVATWATAVVCGVIIWGGLVCYMHLFAGQSFGQALIYAFGNAAGRIALFLYALLWPALALASALYAVLLWQALGIGGTPLWLYAILFLLAAAMIAAAGEQTLSRVALLIVVPSLLALLLNLALTLVGADWANLHPQEQLNGDFLPGGIGGGLLCFGSLSVLLPYFYKVRKLKNHTITLLAAEGFAALIMLLLALGALVALSSSLSFYRFPLLQVFRLAEVGHWFSRFEVIGAALVAGILLLRAAAALAASLAALRELWGFKQGGRLSLAIAVLISLGLWLLLIFVGRRFADWWGLFTVLAGYLPYALLFGAVLLPWAAVIAGMFRLYAEGRTVIISHDEDGR